MPTPIRNITQALPGQITATPAATLNKLAIRVTKLPGVKPIGRRKR